MISIYVDFIDVAGANPLAIRLSIDNLISGGSLEDALSQTQHDVVEFSYSNLIDHLPSIAKEVLECLFKAPEPIDRIEAAQLLDKSVDEVAEGFNRLIRTSLCSRISTEDEEKYELSSSVRELLLINPADADVREEIEERRRSMKLSVFQSKLRQDRGGQNPLSISFLSDEMPQHLRAVAYGAIKAITSKRFNRKRAHDSYKNIKEIIGETSQHPELYRLAGLLLIKLGARQEGKQYLEQAVNRDPFDPAAALELSKKHREDGDLEEAIRIGKMLIEEGWDDPIKGRSRSKQVITAYFLPRIWAGEYEEVIEETRNWRERRVQRKTYGSLHAQALRNYASNSSKHENKAEAIIEALPIVDLLFKKEGYAGYLVVEGARLIEEASKLYIDSEIVKSNVELISGFVDKHLANITSVHRDIEIDDESVKEWVRNIYKMEPHSKNKLRNDKWTSYIKNELSNAVDKDSGPLVVTVKSRPRGEYGEVATYMFAASDFGNKDFLYTKAILIIYTR